MIGAVIKKRRLEKNMSQESLCKGICAISYLSKIESGQVTASEQVIQLLLQNLGVVLPDDFTGANEIANLIPKLWEHQYYGRMNAFMALYDKLSAHDHYLTYSIYAIDWYLLKVCAMQDQRNFEASSEMMEALETYKPYFSNLQSHYYALFKGTQTLSESEFRLALTHYERALQFHHNGVTLFYISNAEYSLGNYINAIRLGSEAYTLLMQEGNLFYAIENTQILAAAYSNVKQLDNAVMLYNRLLNMGQFINDEKVLISVYYNLGATYLACKLFDKAIELLDQLKPHLGAFDDWQFILCYQKLILCDLGLERYDDAREKLRLVNEKLKDHHYPKDHSLIISFRWLNLYMSSNNPIITPTYLEAIRATFDASRKDSHYGFTLFYSDYLIEALKAHRRYKEAIDIKERMLG